MKHIDNLIKIAVAIISIILAVIFIKGIFSGPINSLGIKDDFIVFHKQFEDFWLQADSFLDKFNYLVMKSHWPHPKIIGRLATLVGYYTVGYIHLGYIMIFSNIAMICTCITIYLLYFKDKILFILPILLILLQVHHINFWTVAIIAHGTVYIVLLLFFYCLIRQKYLPALFLLFILFFRSGGGFLVMIPLAIIMFLLYQHDKITLKTIGLFSGASILFFILFYSFTLSGVLENNRTSSLLKDEVSVNFISKIGSIAAYCLQVLGGFFSSRYVPIEHNNYLNFTFGIIGIILIIAFLYKSKSLSTRLYPVFGAAIYFLLLCMLAGLINDKPDQFFETTIIRYKFYSIFFWVSIYTALVQIFYKKKVFYYSYALLLLFCFSGFYKNANSQYIKNLGFLKTRALFNNISGDLYSKPQLDASFMKSLSIHKIYNSSYEKNISGHLNFEKVLNIKLSPDKVKIKPNSPALDQLVEYNMFQENGLLKIVGAVNQKKKRLVTILDFGDFKEYYLINKLKKKTKGKETKYFFDAFIVPDERANFTVSFAGFNTSYHLINSRQTFSTSVLKDNFLNPYNFKDKNKIMQVEEEFYTKIMKTNSNQQKINKALRNRNKQLEQFKSKKKRN